MGNRVAHAALEEGLAFIALQATSRGCLLLSEFTEVDTACLSPGVQMTMASQHVHILSSVKS
jgi:hypothetical protein